MQDRDISIDDITLLVLSDNNFFLTRCVRIGIVRIGIRVDILIDWGLHKRASRPLIGCNWVIWRIRRCLLRYWLVRSRILPSWPFGWESWDVVVNSIGVGRAVGAEIRESRFLRAFRSVEQIFDGFEVAVFSAGQGRVFWSVSWDADDIEIF